MRKLVVSAIVLGILTGPVLAQRGQDPRESEPMVILDKEKKGRAEALDRQYQRTLEQTRKDSDAATRNDPWSNMRAPNDSKR